ncbi:hypothetical protein J7M22_02870 [Candidatus Poribacteria bacterium]|nr:hypothetical protein [Candidatus Poribacteria bacterium]
MLWIVLKVLGYLALSGFCILFWLMVVCALAATMLSSQISQMEERFWASNVQGPESKKEV